MPLEKICRMLNGRLSSYGDVLSACRIATVHWNFVRVTGHLKGRHRCLWSFFFACDVDSVWAACSGAASVLAGDAWGFLPTFSAEAFLLRFQVWMEYGYCSLDVFQAEVAAVRPTPITLSPPKTMEAQAN